MYYVVLQGQAKQPCSTLLVELTSQQREKFLLAGQDLTDKDEDFLSDFRCNNVGFVFQAYNLVSTLTVAENVAFPMEWTRNLRKKSKNEY